MAKVKPNHSSNVEFLNWAMNELAGPLQRVDQLLDLYEKGPDVEHPSLMDYGEYSAQFKKALQSFDFLDFVVMVEGPLSQRFLNIRNKRIAQNERQSIKSKVWGWLDKNAERFHSAAQAAKHIDTSERKALEIKEGYEAIYKRAKEWANEPGKSWKKTGK